MYDSIGFLKINMVLGILKVLPDDILYYGTMYILCIMYTSYEWIWHAFAIDKKGLVVGVDFSFSLFRG